MSTIIEDDESKPLVQRIESGLNDFNSKFFDPIDKFIDEQHNWLRAEGISQLNSADYLGLRRFLYTAINNMIEIDHTIKGGLFRTLKDDIDNLYAIYDEFVSLIKFPDIIYEDKFLPTLELYQKIKSQLDDSMLAKVNYESIEKKTRAIIKEFEKNTNRTADEESEYKRVKSQNADAVHNLANYKDIVNESYDKEKELNTQISEIFNASFLNKSKQNLKDLTAVINIKSYCLDQALWFYAEKSKAIQKFFKNAQIQGNFSLKTYIDYYLKNINTDIGTKDDEVKFLKKAMKDLD